MRILNKEQEESMYRLIEQELELNKENNKLQQRIDKAIEYIETQNPSDIGICGNEKKYYYTLGEDNVDRLLEILKGEE